MAAKHVQTIKDFAGRQKAVPPPKAPPAPSPACLGLIVAAIITTANLSPLASPGAP